MVGQESRRQPVPNRPGQTRGLRSLSVYLHAALPLAPKSSPSHRFRAAITALLSFVLSLFRSTCAHTGCAWIYHCIDWHDAAWFVKQFPAAGQWHLPLIETEDRRDFPAGIRALMDHARSTPDPLQTILWTEPERVSTGISSCHVAMASALYMLSLDVRFHLWNGV